MFAVEILVFTLEHMPETRVATCLAGQSTWPSFLTIISYVIVYLAVTCGSTNTETVKSCG